MQRRAALAALAACCSPAARALMAGEPPDSPAARIDPNTPGSPFSGVASVTFEGGVYSGALIAARYALTAAHVAVGVGSGATFNVCIDGPRPQRIPIVRAVAHPDYRRVELRSVRFDIGLLELAHDAPAAAHRYVIYRGPVAVGQKILLVGFGASGAGSTGPSVGANETVRRTGANRIDEVQRDPERHRPLAYLFTFDPPPENRPQWTRSLGNGVETGLAGGDSGSPAFVGTRESPQLLGVNTLIARRNDAPGALSTYGTIGAGAVAAPHLDWIAQVTAGHR